MYAVLILSRNWAREYLRSQLHNLGKQIGKLITWVLNFKNNKALICPLFKNAYSPIRVVFIDLLSSFSAEMESRIEIFMLKFACKKISCCLDTLGTSYSVLKILVRNMHCSVKHSAANSIYYKLNFQNA